MDSPMNQLAAVTLAIPTDPPLPDLPEELEREILETAAYLNHKHMVNLVRVSRTVKTWIEPLLYDTVYIHDFRGIHSKQDFLESLKRNGRHVRRLLVHDVPNTQLIARYLSCCPNVNDLALWAVIYDDTCLALINALPLKRLSCDLCDFIGSQEGFTKRVCDGHPILTKLTHLDLVGVRITWTWVGLSFLPNLTHLFVPGAIRDVAIRSILDHCQSLRVLIVARNNRNSIPEQSDDLRVVRRNIDDYSQDWEAGARGGRDTYMVAEEEVAERLKKRNTAVVD